MDKVDKVLYSFAALFFVMLLASAFFGAMNEAKKVGAYKEACVATKGTPAYNSKHWECLR